MTINVCLEEMPSVLVDVYRISGGTCCLHDEYTKHHLWKVGTYLPDCKASHRNRQLYPWLPPYEPDVSQRHFSRQSNAHCRSVGTGILYGVKRQWSDVDHSASSSAEVKNEWIYTYAPPICHRCVDIPGLSEK